MVSIDKSTRQKETRVIKKHKETSRQSILVQVRKHVKRDGNVRVHEPVAHDTGSRDNEISESGECDTSIERIASASVLVKRKTIVSEISIAMEL